PDKVTVRGGSNSQSFTVATKTVASLTYVTVTASYNGSEASASVTVQPATQLPKPSLLAFNPNPVTGGSSTTGTVTLDGPAPSGGALVTLTSSNPSVVPAPGPVSIQGGAASAALQVTPSPVTSAAS